MPCPSRHRSPRPGTTSYHSLWLLAGLLLCAKAQYQHSDVIDTSQVAELIKEEGRSFSLEDFDGDVQLLQRIGNGRSAYVLASDNSSVLYERLTRDDGVDIMVLSSEEDRLPTRFPRAIKRRYVVLRQKRGDLYYVVFTYVRDYDVVKDGRDGVPPMNVSSGRQLYTEWDTWDYRGPGKERFSEPGFTNCGPSIFVPCGYNPGLAPQDSSPQPRSIKEKWVPSRRRTSGRPEAGTLVDDDVCELYSDLEGVPIIVQASLPTPQVHEEPTVIAVPIEDTPSVKPEPQRMRKVSIPKWLGGYSGKFRRTKITSSSTFLSSHSSSSKTSRLQQNDDGKWVLATNSQALGNTKANVRKTDVDITEDEGTGRTNANVKEEQRSADLTEVEEGRGLNWGDERGPLGVLSSSKVSKSLGTQDVGTDRDMKWDAEGNVEQDDSRSTISGSNLALQTGDDGIQLFGDKRIKSLRRKRSNGYFDDDFFAKGSVPNKLQGSKGQLVVRSESTKAKEVESSRVRLKGKSTSVLETKNKDRTRVGREKEALIASRSKGGNDKRSVGDDREVRYKMKDKKESLRDVETKRKQGTNMDAEFEQKKRYMNNKERTSKLEKTEEDGRQDDLNPRFEANDNSRGRGFEEDDRKGNEGKRRKKAKKVGKDDDDYEPSVRRRNKQNDDENGETDEPPARRRNKTKPREGSEESRVDSRRRQNNAGNSEDNDDNNGKESSRRGNGRPRQSEDEKASLRNQDSFNLDESPNSRPPYNSRSRHSQSKTSLDHQANDEEVEDNGDGGVHSRKKQDRLKVIIEKSSDDEEKYSRGREGEAPSSRDEIPKDSRRTPDVIPFDKKKGTTDDGNEADEFLKGEDSGRPRGEEIDSTGRLERIPIFSQTNHEQDLKYSDSRIVIDSTRVNNRTNEDGNSHNNASPPDAMKSEGEPIGANPWDQKSQVPADSRPFRHPSNNGAITGYYPNPQTTGLIPNESSNTNPPRQGPQTPSSYGTMGSYDDIWGGPKLQSHKVDPPAPSRPANNGWDTTNWNPSPPQQSSHPKQEEPRVPNGHDDDGGSGRRQWGQENASPPSPSFKNDNGPSRTDSWQVNKKQGVPEPQPQSAIPQQGRSFTRNWGQTPNHLNFNEPHDGPSDWEHDKIHVAAEGAVIANAASVDNKAVANAVSHIGRGSVANAINGSEARANALSTKEGAAITAADTYGEGGARSSSLAMGSGVAFGTAWSRGKGNAEANSVAKSNAAEAIAMSTDTGSSQANAVSNRAGQASSTSLALHGGQSRASSTSNGVGAADAQSLTEGGGNSASLADARGGGRALSQSLARDGGTSHSIASSIGDAYSVSNSVTTGGGRTQADSMAEQGDSVANAVQDSEEAGVPYDPNAFVEGVRKMPDETFKLVNPQPQRGRGFPGMSTFIQPQPEEPLVYLPGWKTQYLTPSDLAGPNATLRWEGEMFYGLGSCPFISVSKEDLLGAGNEEQNVLLRLHMTILRSACLAKEASSLRALLSKGLIVRKKSLFMMNRNNAKLWKKKLTAFELEELTMAFELHLFSALLNNGLPPLWEDPLHSGITRSVRFLSHVLLRGLDLSRAVIRAHYIHLSRHMVLVAKVAYSKLLQDLDVLTDPMDKEYNQRDRAHMMALIQFMIKGLGPVDRGEREAYEGFLDYVKEHAVEIRGRVATDEGDVIVN